MSHGLTADLPINYADAAWREDESSARAGWTAGDGGEVWCLYGQSVPMTWAQICADFGDSLATAVRLVPAPEDAAKREQWPASLHARQQAG
jgi:hypothetical protein